MSSRVDRPHPSHNMLMLAAALIVASLVILAPQWFETLDEISTDALWRLLPPSGSEQRFVIVDIDETSLVRYGPWPWPRERMAHLLQRLHAQGAGVVILDIVFSEERPDDPSLQHALAQHPSVLAQVFDLQHPGQHLKLGHLHGAIQGLACQPPIPVAYGYIGQASSLFSPYAGHITPYLSAGGVVRKLPALLCYQDQVYPVLGLAALMAASHTPAQMELQPGRRLLDPPYWLDLPELGQRLPLDEQAGIRLSYRKPRSAFMAISAADILEERLPQHALQGAWVILGGTAFGLGDVVPTPRGGAVGGVEVHAYFLSNLLDGQHPYTPRGALLIQALIALGGALLLRLTLKWGARRMAIFLPLMAVLLSVGLWGVHAWWLERHNLWLGWSAPASFLILLGLGWSLLEHARARSERERLFANLKSYLPAHVALELIKRDPSGSIEACREEVTVLVADIRNYSAYCEGRAPEEVAALLHAYFTLAVDIIEQHGGVVENFMGDAVLALWSGERRHPRHALAAAQALLETATHLFPAQAPPGLEPLALGIGLETGQALVGSFGPAGRRLHTAMGETITVAIRLQAMTADLAYPILIGPQAARQLEQATLQSLGEFLLEGLRQPRTLYAPRSRENPWPVIESFKPSSS